MLVQLSSMPHPIAIHIHEGGDVNEKPKVSEPKLVLRDVNFYYGRAQALFKVNITVPKNQVTAFIGPSGCGKSTLFRCLNRLNDLVEGWFQHTRKGGLNIIDQPINDIVIANIDAFFLRLALSGSISFDIKADDDSSRCSGQVNISFVDIADTFMNEAYFDILFSDLGQCIFDRFG